MKTDKSKHGICIAAIKKNTFKPFNYEYTRFYEFNSDFAHDNIALDLSEEELIICSTLIDAKNYSILTTQRLITNEEGIQHIGVFGEIKDKGYGAFKGTEKGNFTFGLVELANGVGLKYFIETDYASMIMIHGVRTLIKPQTMTAKNIENVNRIWKRKENQIERNLED